MREGDARAALAAAPRQVSGALTIGGQEHFYLEGQVALALPGEDGDLHVFSSTQHPTETLHQTSESVESLLADDLLEASGSVARNSSTTGAASTTGDAAAGNIATTAANNATTAGTGAVALGQGERRSVVVVRGLE